MSVGMHSSGLAAQGCSGTDPAEEGAHRSRVGCRARRGTRLACTVHFRLLLRAVLAGGPHFGKVLGAFGAGW